MKFINKIDKHFEQSLLVVLFTTMVVVLFTQVVMRAVFNNSLAWSEELTRYCFIYLVFIGISYAVKKRRHLNLTIFINILNNKGKKTLNLFSDLLFLLFAVFILSYGVGLTIDTFKFEQITPSLGIPMGVIYAGVPIGMALTIIRLIQNIYFEFKRKHYPDGT